MTNNNATLWHFKGLFLGGDEDLAGTPVGDICTGYFVTQHSDEGTARSSIINRYKATNPSGQFVLSDLMPCPCLTNPKRPSQILKRGGTKEIPVLD